MSTDGGSGYESYGSCGTCIGSCKDIFRQHWIQDRDDGERLWEEYILLKMCFPVRCKYLSCSVRIGPLRMEWSNNLTILGLLFSRFFTVPQNVRYFV